MSEPQQVLSQLLSPAQAETLAATGDAVWDSAAGAFQALQGAAPAFTIVDARLVMPDEIIGEFDSPHLAIPVELSTNQDQEATAFLVVETSAAAAYLGSEADNPDDQEQQTLVIASTVLGQVVQSLNTQVFGRTPAGLIIALDDITAGTMPDTLASMDDPCMLLTGIVEGQARLPLSLVLPGTFLDIMAGAMAALNDPDARTVSPPPPITLTQEDLEAAELLDEIPEEVPATFEPEPVLTSVGANANDFANVPPPPAQPAAAQREPTPITPAAQRARFAPLPDPATTAPPKNIDLLSRLQMNVSVELGRTELTVAEVLGLGPGSVIELDRLAGEPVDIMVNERLIARGEVVVVDENFGVRVVEVVRRTGESEEQAS